MIFITFKSDESLFCIESKDVTEIVRMVKISPMPSESGKISGLISYRGETIPVLEVSRYIKSSSKVYQPENVIIVVHYNNYKVALLADDLQDILDSDDAHIENHSLLSSDFFDRSIKKGNLIYPVLNLKKVINDVSESMKLVKA